jgi:hypothetical protein
MNTVLWAGTVVGAVFGMLHAVYVYRLVAVDGHIRAGYYALWTLGLWLVFGTYVLVMWVISVVAYAIARPFRWRM